MDQLPPKALSGSSKGSLASFVLVDDVTADFFFDDSSFFLVIDFLVVADDGVANISELRIKSI